MKKLSQFIRNYENAIIAVLYTIVGVLLCALVCVAVSLFQMWNSPNDGSATPIECTEKEENLLIDSKGNFLHLKVNGEYVELDKNGYFSTGSDGGFNISVNGKNISVYGHSDDTNGNAEDAADENSYIDYSNNSSKNNSNKGNSGKDNSDKKNDSNNKKDNTDKKDNVPVLSPEERVAQEVVAKVKGKSAYEQLLYFHDYVCQATRYDDVNVAKGVITDAASSAKGVFVDGVAVCSGYAKAFQLLCNSAGFKCYYVVGDCYEGGCHAWNIVNLGGEWFQVDVCWDDAENGFDYEYFLVPDAVMSKSRTWDTSKVPACTSYKYVASRYLVAADLKEAEAIVSDSYNKGVSEVIFLTTFPIDLNGGANFLFNYDMDGDGTYSYVLPEQVGPYYRIHIYL